MKIAKRLKALREQYGWSQADLVAASGLTRPDVSKLESGINRAGSLRVRDALARAYQLNPSEVGEYIEGKRRLETLLPGKKSPLEGAITEYPGRWSSPTIAAARAMPFDDRIDVRSWVEHLDGMERALAAAAPRRLWGRGKSGSPRRGARRGVRRRAGGNPSARTNLVDGTRPASTSSGARPQSRKSHAARRAR